MRENDQPLLDLYLSFFPLSSMAELSESVIVRARNMGAHTGLRVPDALHMATAIEQGADVLLTGDKRLARKSEVRAILLEPTPSV